jgi:hypothetical protein
MIKIETEEIRGIEFKKTYSDAGFLIRQDGTGIEYSVAYDPLGSDRTYTETEEKIPEDGLIEDEYEL